LVIQRTNWGLLRNCCRTNRVVAAECGVQADATGLRPRPGTACETWVSGLLHANVTLGLWGWVIKKNMSDDAADVQRVLAGDVDAYAALVDRYYDRCARFAVRMLGNRDDAEDALQVTFVRAYRALDRYQERDRFSAWLYRILVNQCRSIAARRAHREKVFVREEALLLNAPDRSTSWSGEDEEFVQRVLSELDPLLREAFLLKYIEEMSYEEMSTLTGVGVSALKMRVKRACDRLRERWERIKHD
jgi:RNA polymerase sigma-70 factor (ECF subfamily)